tara:strand:+ start:1238 stop:1441 length:204 start_codon:yes stop_codon:yes gene_type:complete
MEIVKGSEEYIYYIQTNIFPDITVADYIGTIDYRTQVDMLDSGELITYSDEYVRENMKENGYTLIIP